MPLVVMLKALILAFQGLQPEELGLIAEGGSQDKGFLNKCDLFLEDDQSFLSFFFLLFIWYI